MIPYRAICPGAGGDPITFDGPVTQQRVLDALEEAGPSAEETSVAESGESTMALTR